MNVLPSGPDDDFNEGWREAGRGTVAEIAEWLRGDEAERVARNAEREGIPPEDALAHAIEEKWQP